MNVRRKHKSVFAHVLSCFLLVFLTVCTPMSAQSQKNPDDWNFALAIYGWYSDINAETTRGQESEIEAQYAIDNFEMAFMGSVEARKKDWSFLIDTFYISTEDKDPGIPNRQAELELKNWIITPIVAYRFVNRDNFELSVLGGARYLSLETDLAVTTRGGIITSSQSEDNWDAIIGLRGSFMFGPSWYIPFHLDIGAGDSDFTWQALAGLGYRFDWGDIEAGYRYIDWEFDDRPGIAEMDYSGPFVGVKFRF